VSATAAAAAAAASAAAVTTATTVDRAKIESRESGVLFISSGNPVTCFRFQSMRYQRVSKDRKDRRAQPLSRSRVQPISFKYHFVCGIARWLDPQLGSWEATRSPNLETLFICLDSGERAKCDVREIEDPRILGDISRVSSDGAFGQRSAWGRAARENARASSQPVNMICHTHATGSNRTTRDTDDDDDDEEEEDDEEKDDTRPLRGHATSTLCARMRPARLLPDCPSTYQQQQKQQQQRLRKKGKKLISRHTLISVKSKDVIYRHPLSLSLVKEAIPKSSTTITEEVPLGLDWRDLRVQRTANIEPTTTVQPSRRRRRRRNPGALAFPRRCGAVVRSTGVGWLPQADRRVM